MLRASAVAGFVSYLILALALVFGVQETHLGTAWAYFLTGAVAGLFLRLRSAGTATEVADDYGLEAARLYQTPLLSGMAAVMGVVMMASIGGSSLNDIINPNPDVSLSAVVSVEPSPSAEPVAAETVTGPSDQDTMAPLADAFDLGKYPIGLVIALVFGLTPGLVPDRLGASLAGTKSAITSSRPAKTQ